MKTCNWCKTTGETGRTFWEHDPDGDGIRVDISPESREIQVFSPIQCKDIEVNVPIRYCPMCGRKL